jgi:hypothetical protein
MTLLLVGTAIASSSLIPFIWRFQGWVVVCPVYLTAAMHILFRVLLDPGLVHKFLPRYYSKKSFETKSHSFFHIADGGSEKPAAMAPSFSVAH